MSHVRYRKLTVDDYADAAALYLELAGDHPVISGVWGEDRFAQILHHDGTNLIGAVVDGTVTAMATLHILPNMTYDGRPYCLIENVITHHADRGQGYGRGVLDYAARLAWDAKAYKIMLLTGQGGLAQEFYRKCGYDSDEKQGFILRRNLVQEKLD